MVRCVSARVCVASVREFFFAALSQSPILDAMKLNFSFFPDRKSIQTTANSRDMIAAITDITRETPGGITIGGVTSLDEANTLTILFWTGNSMKFANAFLLLVIL